MCCTREVAMEADWPLCDRVVEVAVMCCSVEESLNLRDILPRHGSPRHLRWE